MTRSRRMTRPIDAGWFCRNCHKPCTRARIAAGDTWVHTATESIYCDINLAGITARFADPVKGEPRSRR